MNPSDFTQSQVEHILAQHIQELYSEWLGNHQSQVTCHLSSKTLTILIENCVSSTERAMIDMGDSEAAARWREKLEGALQPHLRTTIETDLQISVLDLLGDTSLKTDRTGFIVVLESVPTYRVESL
ncbi:MAG: Na-translocating system protein MpsC family protein [Geitlerinemataceae cyanobacterium]